MRGILFPAALALSILSAAMPAAAVEGTLDGVVYALPDDSRFELQTMHLPEPGNLQNGVDEVRKNARPDSVLILFRSRPNSKDAPRTIYTKAPPQTGPILTLFRDPTTLPEYRVAIDRSIKDAVFRDGVARLVVRNPGSEKPPYARSYAVRTGLGFAPEADAHCDDVPNGTRCFVEAARPGRLRLRWSSLNIDETSPHAVRAHVRDLIAKALPVEMEKEGKRATRRP